METQVQDRTLTQSLNASPYAEAAKLAAQKQMLEQDLAAQMQQREPKEAKQEVAQQPKETPQQAKVQEAQARVSQTELMSPEELAQHKASIQQLYAEKDQTLQQLQRNPKTTVKDGVLMGTGLGAAAAYGIKMVGDHQGRAVNNIKELLHKFVQSDGSFKIGSDDVKRVTEKMAKAGDNITTDSVETFLQQAQQYFTPQHLQQTVGKNLQEIFKSSDNLQGKQLDNMFGQLSKLIDPKTGQVGEIPDKLKDKLKEANIDIKQVTNKLDEVAAGAKGFTDNEIYKGIFAKAEQGLEGISNTIGKFIPVESGKQFVQNVFENMAGEHGRGAQLGTGAALIGGTALVVVAIKGIAEHGKSEKHDKLKSHVDKLDEKIMQEQQALKAGLGI